MARHNMNTVVMARDAYTLYLILIFDAVGIVTIPNLLFLREIYFPKRKITG
jgi:hypothetical protein